LPTQQSEIFVIDPMNTSAVLIALAASTAIGLLVERWATPWIDGLLKKGSIDPWRSGRLWALLVVGSATVTYLLIQPTVLDLLQTPASPIIFKAN
jgi:hypothetical protein